MRCGLLLVVMVGVTCFSTAGIAQALLDLHEEADIPCVACHTENPPFVRPSTEACVACHGTMTGAVEGTVPEGPDPHRSPHLGADEVPICSECHSVHGKSEDSCSLCHRGFDFRME